MAKQGWQPTDEELKFIDKCREAGDNLTLVAKKLKSEFGIVTTPSTVCRKIAKYSNKLINKPRPKFPSHYYFILHYEKKISIPEVAILTQRKPETVRYHLANKDEQEKYAAYRAYSENKSSTWEYTQARMAQKLNEDMVDSMDGKDLVNAMVKMEDKIRVMRGEVTTIVGLEGFDRELAELDAEETKLRKAIDVIPEKIEEFDGEEELLKLTKEVKLLESK